ncbi:MULTISPECIES: ferritin-like domain-containing protein [Calothrix]|uniref:Isovaleryl-CoA dehydrogenase n=2 Tax=Calothrix TaxID=1186 RepID=A0ABR8A8Y4_9CYAN|nr:MULTISPECIES: ferritin-like domain-containing protein [Calothrix]MBD2195506.1 isovaleryl-CoA dehydrogenase [Calothrix parietina FACHB-288]MBD2228406.1 isovaleryl-CoA dehydrogenase [Calothrix anomala FACHB-343]
MSILDFPRLHFQGFARIHAPTGHKNGQVDVSSNTVYMNGKPVDLNRPVSEYHEYLYNLGTRFNAEGQLDENGAFSSAMGWNFGGNGHFSIEAQIVSTQREFGQIDRQDPVVGRSVDLWGHYNDYVKTTFNRARFFECDPASNWTNTIMLGQLTFGRQGASHEVPNMLSAPITGMQLARWQNFDYIRELPEHCLNQEFKRAAVYQFAIPKDAEDWLWGEEVAQSPTVTMLREAMNRNDVLGLVVQFSISNMSAPVQPDSPSFWELHGTIGLWCKDELSSYPHGRLLISEEEGRGQEAEGRGEGRGLSNLTLQVSSQGISLNMITAVPCVGRAAKPGPGPTHAIGCKLDLGDLEVRTVGSQRLIGRIFKDAYQLPAYQLTSGIVDVQLAEPFENLRDEIEQQGLCIIGTDVNGERQILVKEQEINLQIDDACLFIEHPNLKTGEDHAVELEVRSFVRGCPTAVESVYLSQFYNPRAFPQLRDRTNLDSTFHFPHPSEMAIVHFKPGKQAEPGDFAPKTVISTDATGRGWVTLRGAIAGTAKVLLSTQPDEFPGDINHVDAAEIAYDNDNKLGFWSGAGFFAVRVLSNDWHLDEIPTEAVDFNLIYKHVLAYYELCFSFMKVDVFSLADKCKVETYARLMWQMSDPKNKYKTYYMPPSRDMSQAKTTLLRKFLQNQQRVGYVPPAIPEPKHSQRTIQTRAELVSALKQAAELEVAVMLQYIYAGYSIPNYVTGEEYVRRGLWTQEQLHLACGDGKEVKNYGMRGVLIEISREEMIHFLMVNNILMAIGEPFYPAVPDFSKLNQRFPIDVDLALEPLNPTSLQRFLRLEMPDFLEENLANEPASSDRTIDSLHGYGSLSELYRQIRQGLENIPDLFVVKKGRVGGEHRLFLRDDFNKAHPDYQLQVDDLNSALFAIDLIVEQGEGCEQKSAKFERSHYQQFSRLADALAQEQINDTKTERKRAWNPSYPSLRNPCLNQRDYNSNVVTVPQTRAVMEIFNESYFLMMQLMVQHFGFMPTGSLRRSKLMNAGIDVMTGMMRPLGELLMSMPSGKRGKTAGPSFEIDTPAYIPVPEVAMNAISRRFERLGQKARECEVIHSTVSEMFDYYAKFFDNLANNPQSLLH